MVNYQELCDHEPLTDSINCSRGGTRNVRNERHTGNESSIRPRGKNASNSIAALAPDSALHYPQPKYIQIKTQATGLQRKVTPHSHKPRTNNVHTLPNECNATPSVRIHPGRYGAAPSWRSTVGTPPRRRSNVAGGPHSVYNQTSYFGP